MFHPNFYLTNYFQSKNVEHFEKVMNLLEVMKNYIDNNHYKAVYLIENKNLQIVHLLKYILTHLVDYPKRHYQIFDEQFLVLLNKIRNIYQIIKISKLTKWCYRKKSDFCHKTIHFIST